MECAKNAARVYYVNEVEFYQGETKNLRSSSLKSNQTLYF